MNFTRILAMIALMAAAAAHAQNAPQSNTVGDNSSVDQQVIGDTNSTADHTNSVSTQLGNSANANGAQVNPTIDTRDQNTVTSTGGAGGSSTGNLSNNDNRSNASNGNQSMGQANTGNSSVGNTSATTGNNTNTVGGSYSGGNTLTNGSNTATNTANGGAGGSVAGSGNSANANTQSTNTTNALGQQQGIAGSGNSTNNVKGGDQRNAQGQGQGQGQQQAANAAQGQGQGQGQSSNNRISGGNQSATTTSRSSQNASTKSGVGQSGNSQTMVNTGGNIDNTRVDARTLIVPRVTPDVPPSLLAAGTMQVVADATCGPLMDVREEEVYGISQGWFWDSKVALGKQQTLTQYLDQNGTPVYFLPVKIGARNVLIGQKHTMVAGIISTAAGKTFGLGGGNSNMAYGQGGAGNTSAMQQMLEHHVLRTCIYAVEMDAPPPPPAIPTVTVIRE